ncbi:BRD4-interacting chromatin-remodeling complex-associated protein-like [Vulpes lagopus]|uniref:BRD4-interacting chromatin-remodeling complex-associated protein-like n=1 Tax=Vulpes lagopus TaxID=494514 RepID=UPI001BCA1B34|nr:BRD4-interacting chromatin-remodeling complex-associated protein-like [Vulpes lagopus]
MGKVGMDVGGLVHCLRPASMPSQMKRTLPAFTGYGPPQPPPRGWTQGPHPPLAPPPHGLRAHSEACAAQGDESNTVPKKVPEKDQMQACFWGEILTPNQRNWSHTQRRRKYRNC